jgi:transposase
MIATKYSSLSYDVFIGIDVDKNSYSFTAKDHANMIISKKIPAQPEQLYNYMTKRFSTNRILCAYEAGPTGLHLFDYLSERNIQCLVLSPFSNREKQSYRF